MEAMTRIKALKTFFEADGGRAVTREELVKLTKEERHELGNLAAKELGVEIVEA